MRQLLSSLQDKKSNNEVMGIEGLCSNIYSRVYGMEEKIREFDVCITKAVKYRMDFTQNKFLSARRQIEL